MICPNCKSNNVEISIVEERKSGGCFMIVLYIFLAITILGWLVLIPLLLTKKTRTVTYGLCRRCGCRWEITEGQIVAARQQANMQVQNINNQARIPLYSSIPQNVDVNAELRVTSSALDKNTNGAMCLNVRLVNLTGMNIRAVKFEATATNSFGDDIIINGNKVFEAIAQDINLAAHSFTDVRNIALPNNEIRNVSIKIKQFVCSNGEIKVPKTPFLVKTMQNPLSNEQIAQISPKYANVRFLYRENPQYWQCICGMVNRNDAYQCQYCSTAKTFASCWSAEKIAENIGNIKPEDTFIELEKDKKLAIIGLSFSVAGFVLSCVFGFGTLLAIPGVIISLVAMLRHKGANDSLKTLGLVFGGIAIIIGIIFFTYTISNKDNDENAISISTEIASEENTTSEEKYVNDLDRLLPDLSYSAFVKAARSCNIDITDITDVEKQSDWAAGERYFFRSSGCGMYLYLLNDGSVSSINLFNPDGIHIYDEQYISLDIGDFIPNREIYNELQIMTEEAIAQYLKKPDTAKYNWLMDGECARTYNYYELSISFSVENAVGEKETHIAVAEYDTTEDARHLECLSLDGEVVYGESKRPEIVREEKEIYTSTDKGFKIIEGVLGEYGQEDLFDDVPYIRYYLPKGKYKVTSDCNSGGFYIETVEKHIEEGFEDATVIETYKFESVGESVEIEARDGECISLIIGTRLIVEPIEESN